MKFVLVFSFFFFVVSLTRDIGRYGMRLFVYLAVDIDSLYGDIGIYGIRLFLCLAVDIDSLYRDVGIYIIYLSLLSVYLEPSLCICMHFYFGSYSSLFYIFLSIYLFLFVSIRFYSPIQTPLLPYPFSSLLFSPSK